MQRARPLFLFLFAVWLALATGASQAATPVLPLADDMAAHARVAAAHDRPLVVLVTIPNCRYCHMVRQQYLLPMLQRNEIDVREVDMTSSRSLRDFDGRTTTSQAWAKARDVRLAPTVLFLDTTGKPLAPGLVGVSAEFYGAYLQQALDASHERLTKAHGTISGSN